MINSKKNEKIRGFTLVEMMVSVAIFSIIMVFGIGALVSMMDKYQVSQQEKEVADSLNFVLESITREIRLGTNYYSNPSESGNSGSTNNGTALSGNLIGFDSSDGRGYIIYSLNNGVLSRRKIVSGTPTDETLTSASQVYISNARVRVLNAEDPDDLKQPLVWIQFLAYSPRRPDSKKVIQTLVSQRVLDSQ